MSSFLRGSIFVLLVLFLSVSAVMGDDWPQFRGPMRDGASREKGLLKSWPKEGPPLIWKNPNIGEGCSNLAIVGNKIYTNSQLKKVEYLVCLNADTGKVNWATPIAPARNYGGIAGSHSTPTVHRDMVYSLGTSGDIVCCDASSGKVLWRRNMVREMGGNVPQNGYSESLLVDGKWVVCTPGGNDVTVCAMYRVNGQPVYLSGMRPWKCSTGEPAGNSSIVKASIGKTQQYLVYTGKSLIGVRVRGGDKLWSYDAVQAPTNTNTPIWYAQTVFVTGPDNSALIWPQKTAGGSFTTKEIYNTDEFAVPMLGAVRVNDFVFGGTGDNKFGCMNLKDGKLKWETEKCGEGCTVTYADGNLYVRNAKGGVSLVSANSDKYALNGRLIIPGGPRAKGFTAPAIANGRLYLRSNNFLCCFDISKDGTAGPQSGKAPAANSKAPLKPIFKPSAQTKPAAGKTSTKTKTSTGTKSDAPATRKQPTSKNC